MIEKTCTTCGDTYKIKMCRKDTAIFCSINCKAVSQRGVAKSKAAIDKLTDTWKKRLENGYVSPMKGITLPPEWSANISRSKIGPKNPQWRGDDVGYEALHEWVKRRIDFSQCEMCGDEEHLDLANVSGMYKRDLSDWQVLCRRCHMQSDGRLVDFISHRKPFKKGHNKHI